MQITTFGSDSPPFIQRNPPSTPPPSPVQDSISQANQNPSIYPAASILPGSLAIEEDAHIPLFDLDDIENAPTEIRKELIKQFGDGLKDIGFIAIKAPSLSAIIKDVTKSMKTYFALPLEEKMKDWNSDNSKGFSEQGRETAAGATHADRKETFFVPPHFKKWPQTPPEFGQVMERYHTELTNLAIKVMRYVAEYLEEPTENVSETIDTAYNLLRLAYYPAPKSEDHPDSVWANAHEDLNALTLLPPTKVPGLQLFTKDERWLSVTAPEGSLILNTGLQLERLTAGLIKATLHRVQNPGGKYTYQARHSSIFFASWAPEKSLAPLKKCVEKITENMSEEERTTYLLQYPDVTVQENLISRLIEMGTIPNPTREQVAELHQKGLLQRPPLHVVEEFSDLFNS
ncbi:isopenicillin N synthase family dioxygenase [Parachlamydia acanthamoebae]|uniref:Fe2OG dioxygenase domain-containing protein n=2 Tax=Parachlamydia acanthamoebae TaxID=83552 RepID=F8KXT0_PARAV|nr:2-oxoglutarate and iron-dependent oxygenase domain-containing protein [Parachlamydia acanthamoebae]KIA78578.1 putative flavonol synthase 5 [Parachlamydia acanthamoebae]CCB85660.1 putative uncharacterized protein [Parachlamydia acanthamoebae UV-7]